MRERPEAREHRAIVGLAALAGRDHRHDRAQMARTEAPEMQVGDPIAAALDRPTQIVGHVAVRVHVQKDGAGVADQRD